MVAHKKKSNSKVLNQDKEKDNSPSNKNSLQAQQTLDTDLYVCVTDVNNKRKSLLKALKLSLLAQEEYEAVYSIRREKFEKIDKLRKEIEKINSEYGKLQKLFPNPKNVISFAEKELNELEHQVENLIETNEINKEEMGELENLEKNMDQSDEELTHRQEEIKSKLKAVKGEESPFAHHQQPNHYQAPPQKVEQLQHKHSTYEDPKKSTKKISKLDRIQNNLSIIEEKLNGL